MQQVLRLWLSILVCVLLLLGLSSSLLQPQKTVASVRTYAIAAQPCGPGTVFSGPIQIGTGGTYTGNWESTAPSAPAVFIYTTDPVTIVNSCLRGPGELISTGVGSNVTVKQSSFVGTNPNVAGMAKGSPIHAFQPANLIVENCDFEGGGFFGIWVQQYSGNRTPNNTIKILKNRIHNVDGRFSNGQGGYLTNQNGACHGIALGDVHGVPGIEIAWNQIINEPYQSGGEIDLINIYESSGTQGSPMQIHDNYLQGEYAADPANANALGLTGSAFTTDGSAQTDPNLTTSFLKIHHNQAVSTGSAGIGIAIGHDIEMNDNRVVSSGQLSDGTNITVTYAAGMAHWNWRYPPPAPLPPNFGNNSVHDNVSGLRRMNNGVWERFDYYIPVPPATSFNNAQWSPASNAAPTLTDEANERLLWEEKLIKQSITVGSQLVVPAIRGSLQIISGNNQVGLPNSDLAAPIVIRALDSAGAPVAGLNLSFMIAAGSSTATPHFAVTDSNGTASTQIHLGATLERARVNILAVGFPLISADFETVGSNALVQLSTASYTVSEGANSATIFVVRPGDSSSPASINYATSDTAGLKNCSTINGIASSRCDYATSVGTLTFAPGETSKSVSIPFVDDAYAEGGESFTITLSNPTGAAVGSPGSATVTINDNETVNGPNPIDQTSFFVRQHYIDFLGREPDPGGAAGWEAVINTCPAGDTTCDRIHVSSAFFRSAEFQGRGYFIYRFYPVAFGRKPDYVEFIPDLAKVSGFLSDAELEAAKIAFIGQFMSRPAFITQFNGLTNTQYVDALLSTAQVTSPHRDFWIAALGNGTRTRATVLRDISESPEVYNKYYNQAFVVMQYFGYLRRDPDALYLDWIQVLDTTGDHRGMVNGFMNSLEYRFRFGP